MSRVELPQLTSEETISILEKVLERLQSPETTEKLDQARFEIGNDMLKMMRIVFPMVMQVMIDVFSENGHPNVPGGIIKRARMIRALEREDPEIARLHGLIKAYYLPPVVINTTAESPPDEAICSN